jgi:uncharacterized protein YpbB
MAYRRPMSTLEARVHSNALLERILEELAAEGYLEPTDTGYGITAAGEGHLQCLRSEL